MRLTKIEIRNYRLLIDANLKVDTNTTLIVGRNNTAKTSCMDFLYKVLNDKKLSYNDYPLLKRKLAFIILAKFMKGTYSFEQLIAKIPKPSIRFFVDYSQESEEENLGALSPFIIDVDENISNAIILAEYTIKLSEDKIKELFKKHIQFDEKGNLSFNKQDIRELVSANFSTIFSLEIKAINPCNDNDVQSKSSNDLKELFPLYTISAERDLDESGNASSSSLQKVISNYGNATIKDYLEIHYSQFLSAINFLYPETEFSTDHGVKGEEYDNVIFAITKGWNQYQFELFAPMILNGYPKDKESTFIRNRNLFYVCCSRPKKRLIIFVSLEVDSVFETFLKKLSGVKNYYTFPEYIKKLQLPKM